MEEDSTVTFLLFTAVSSVLLVATLSSTVAVSKVEGTYYVDVTVDGGYEVRIVVVVTAAREAYIETVKEPSNPVNLKATGYI